MMMYCVGVGGRAGGGRRVGWWVSGKKKKKVVRPRRCEELGSGVSDRARHANRTAFVGPSARTPRNTERWGGITARKHSLAYTRKGIIRLKEGGSRPSGSGSCLQPRAATAPSLARQHFRGAPPSPVAPPTNDKTGTTHLLCLRLLKRLHADLCRELGHLRRHVVRLDYAFAAHVLRVFVNLSV